MNGNNIPKCFRFRITTNGNLITKNLDLLENIKDQISEVTVSLDAGTSDTYKEIRGGSFKDVGYYLQTSARTYEYQDTAKSYIGFRCIMTYLGSIAPDIATISSLFIVKNTSPE